MQSVQYDQSNSNELQASLDAYLDNHLEFSELRTQWIITLSEQPEMRSGAVRLLYQQSADRHLSEQHALALKRIVETTIRDDEDDWTIVLDEDDPTEPCAIDVYDDTNTGQEVRADTVVTRISMGDELGPGSILKDRFELGEQLGRGGIGIVFRAQDRLRQRVNTGSAQVAVKVLREEYRSKPELLTALQTEALQAQDLSHPNIVRIHDFHQDRDICFLTMELLEGELLRSVFSRLEPATIPTEAAVRIIAGMCRGLAHAHAHGLVHGDFKPSNVFLTTKNETKIFDFGFAHAETAGSQTNNGSARPASKALRAITPAYSSCNRLEGGTPGFSDDVYSLSCVIYELLAGRHPYDNRSALMARELNLSPERINGLTTLQWRTLSAGLRPSRQDRTTEVHDLQHVFTRPVEVQAPSKPIERKPNRSRPLVSAIMGFLFGAGLILGLVIFDIDLVPSKYTDLALESKLLPVPQPTTDTRSDEPVSPEDLVPSKPSSEVASRPVVAIADSEKPPRAEESVQPTANEPDVEVTLQPLNGPDPQVSSALPIVPGFQFESSEYFIRENDSALAITVNRRGDLSEPTSVEYTTFAGSAESQLDYAGFFRRQVRFAAGEETKIIFIPIVSDTYAESDENFRIALSRPDGTMILAEPYTATITIIDDDA